MAVNAPDTPEAAAYLRGYAAAAAVRSGELPAAGAADAYAFFPTEPAADETDASFRKGFEDGDGDGDEAEDDESGEPGEAEDEDEDAGEPDSSPDPVAAAAGLVIPHHIVERASALPVPTGLLGIFAILAVLILLLVPANQQGQTRFELLWRAITGGVTLAPTQRVAAVPQTQEVQAADQAAASEWGAFWNG